MWTFIRETWNADKFVLMWAMAVGALAGLLGALFFAATFSRVVLIAWMLIGTILAVMLAFAFFKYVAVWEKSENSK